jgi:hypothetical protein
MAAFATSYIKTEAASVTRNADAATMTGANFSSWYRADEGTLYAEAAFLALAVSRQVVAINDSSVNNLISIQTNPSTASTSRFTVTANGVPQAPMGFASAFTAGSFSKHAGAYKTNDFAFSSNAATATTDTSGIVPVVNQMQLGAVLTTTSNVFIKKIAYYPTRCTDAQLQALTTV